MEETNISLEVIFLLVVGIVMLVLGGVLFLVAGGILLLLQMFLSKDLYPLWKTLGDRVYTHLSVSSGAVYGYLSDEGKKIVRKYF